jgi:outer membrane biosynthesis protein TonB
MRYTSESTMDDRALRDVERWKDKIEVRLDNRQVFFLFFGSALVACLLFILGVIVGKRLESRGKAAAPEIEDPLALLDKVASAPRTGPEPPAALPKVLFGAGTVPAKAAPAPRPAPPPAAAAKVEPPRPEPAKPEAKVEAKVAARAEPRVEPKPEARPEPPPAAPAAPSKPIAAAVPPKKVAVAPTPASPPGAGDPARFKGRFTLQLGSFPDRAEAEAFSQRFAAQGSYVIASEIPNKGTWYRVRVGDYASAKDAIAAKSAFEKQHNVIAYVVGPR